jgi:hypothetical protein
MDGEDVSRETSSPSVCGEILHGCGGDWEMSSPFTWSKTIALADIAVV